MSSHLRASRGRQPLSNSIGEAGCDLLLAFDHWPPQSRVISVAWIASGHTR